MVTLRPYQERAIQQCLNGLHAGEHTLLQAPTGAGKSIMLATIAKQLFDQVPDFRCCLLIDREILVRQLRDTFESILGFEVGVACASVEKEVNFGARMVIGSRQTLSNRIEKLNPFHLVILDEAHLIPLQNKTDITQKDGQYNNLLRVFGELNPSYRLLGCSATPWRLGTGFIYGNKCRPDLKPWFGGVNSKISFKELTDAGHLCKLEGRLANFDELDLSEVKKIGYEFNLADLGKVMCKHVDNVQRAIDEHLEGHKHILVFACTIEHAEQITEVTADSATLHSKTDKPERVLRAFENGDVRVLVSVNKISLGFDMPKVSAAIIARPTESSALYVQMVGRILRPHPDKDKAILVDLTDNTLKHCPQTDLDRVRVNIPPAKKTDEYAVAPIKFCEAETAEGFCYAENHLSAKFCLVCGAEFPTKSIPLEYMPNLTAAEFEAVPDEWYDVEGMDIQAHESKKSGKMLLKVRLSSGGYTSKSAYIWICTQDHYDNKFALEKGAEWWGHFTGGGFIPDNIDTALWLAQSQFATPKRMYCEHTPEGYLNIKKLDMLGETTKEEAPF